MTDKLECAWDIRDTDDDLLLFPEHIDGYSPLPGQFHIMPVDDLHPHMTSPRCWCHPEGEDDDGEIIWQHFAADQRELYEAGKLRKH